MGTYVFLPAFPTQSENNRKLYRLLDRARWLEWNATVTIVEDTDWTRALAHLRIRL
jgi:hypothetical protein